MKKNTIQKTLKHKKGTIKKRGKSDNPIIDFRNRYAPFLTVATIVYLCDNVTKKEYNSLRVKWSNAQLTADENGNYNVTPVLVQDTESMVEFLKEGLKNYYQKSIDSL